MYPTRHYSNSKDILKKKELFDAQNDIPCKLSHSLIENNMALGNICEQHKKTFWVKLVQTNLREKILAIQVVGQALHLLIKTSSSQNNLGLFLNQDIISMCKFIHRLAANVRHKAKGRFQKKNSNFTKENFRKHAYILPFIKA